MDPHSIAHFLFSYAGLTIPSTSLRDFWQHHSHFQEPWAKDVPMDAVPMGIYGDGARVYTKFGTSTNLIAVFFNFPLWKPQTVRTSRFLVAVVPEHQTWEHHTLQVILRRGVWIINCLIDGFHPSMGPYNETLPKNLEELAGKPFEVRFRMCEIRGDWQWHKRVFRFKNCSWNAKDICFHCRARSQADDPRELYWSYDSNNFDDHPFTLGQFLDERMPAQDICFLDNVSDF